MAMRERRPMTPGVPCYLHITLLQLRLPRRAQYRFQRLRRLLHNQIRIPLRDVVGRRKDQQISICAIRHTAAGDDRDADVFTQPFRVDAGCNLRAGREGSFAGFVFDELDLAFRQPGVVV